MSTVTLLLILIFSLLAFTFCINFKWSVKTIRDIAKDECGYTKLVQIGMILLLVLIFVTIVCYYLITPAKVDRIDIILTVVVGWLGAIIGNFFGEKAMGSLEDKRKLSTSRLIVKAKEQEEAIKSLLEKVERNLKKK